MTELVFHPELYSGFAIDAATKTYDEYATFELEKRENMFVVRLTSKGEFPEEQIADEFSNYALGATIEERDRRTPDVDRVQQPVP